MIKQVLINLSSSFTYLNLKMAEKAPISEFFNDWLERRWTPQPPLQIRPQTHWELDLLKDMEDLTKSKEIKLPDTGSSLVNTSPRMITASRHLLNSDPRLLNFDQPLVNADPVVNGAWFFIPFNLLSPNGAPPDGVKMVRQRRYKPKQKNKEKNVTPSVFCVFCKKNGENPGFYKSHVVKDPETKICTCPKLRALDPCRKCGAFGDYSHTIMHCPKNQPPEYGTKPM